MVARSPRTIPRARAAVEMAMAKYEPVLLRNRGVQGARTLAVYRERGGYRAAEKAISTMSPGDISIT